MSIYKPTWLYIKQHNQTGLKYFGKTISKDPEKYKGSGKYWIAHLKKHGYNVSTIWCQLFENEYDIKKYALTFSNEHQIVSSTEWANLIPEDGISGGGVKGTKKPPRNESHIAHAAEANAKKKGIPLSADHRQKVSAALHGKSKPPRSSEHSKKISTSNKGLPRSFSKETCKHCGVSGGENVMRRWHGDNCNLIKPRKSKEPVAVLFSSDSYKARSEKTKGIAKPKYTCVHCGKIVGGKSNLERYHNMNCKSLNT